MITERLYQANAKERSLACARKAYFQREKEKAIENYRTITGRKEEQDVRKHVD